MKPARDNQLLMYKVQPIGLSADFLAETLQVRRQQNEIFKGLNKQNPSTKNTISGQNCPSKEGEIKTFTKIKNQNPREFMNTRPRKGSVEKGPPNQMERRLLRLS